MRVLLTIAVPIRKANKPQMSGPSRTMPVLVEPICATSTFADVGMLCKIGIMLYDVVRDRENREKQQSQRLESGVREIADYASSSGPR